MFSADLGVNQVASNFPFNKVALLLHGDGTNGAQNNTFVDGSTNNFTITRTGNVAQGTFSPFSLADGQWSNYFDGSGDYLTLSGGMPSGQGTAFTMECWVYFTSLSGYNAISRGNLSGYFDFGVTSAGAVALDNTSVVRILNSADGVIKTNAWYHIAITRSAGNIYKIWVNGENVATSSAYNVSISANTTIGYSSFSAGHYLKRYLFFNV